MDVVIMGGVGSGAIVLQSVLALSLSNPNIRMTGFLNDALPRGDLVSGVPVLGPFASWRDLPETTMFVAPLHKAKMMSARLQIIEVLGIPQERFITIIDPRSAVATDAIIGHGSFVGPFASVGPASILGAHCMVRAGAHVSHDCVMEDFVFVGTNAVILGYSRVHRGGYIAPGTTVRDGCRIGEFSVVGLGSVVTKDVAAGTTVIGNPARQMTSDGRTPSEAS